MKKVPYHRSSAHQRHRPTSPSWRPRQGLSAPSCTTGLGEGTAREGTCGDMGDRDLNPTQALVGGVEADETGARKTSEADADRSTLRLRK